MRDVTPELPVAAEEFRFSQEYWLITLANGFMFLNVSFLFLLPQPITRLGGDAADIGIIMGSYGVAGLGSIPWIAHGIDRYGSKPFMLAGVSLMAAASVGYIFLTRLTYLFVPFRLLQGLALAMMFNGATTAATLRIPAQRMAQGLGIFGAFTIASRAIGPSLGELIVERWGFSPLFFILAASFSVVALLVLADWRWSPRGEGS